MDGGAYSLAAQAHPQRNEDALLLVSKYGLGAVCDGLGGHSHGECASAAACQGVLTLVPEIDNYQSAMFVEAALVRAGQAVKRSQAAAHDDQATTIALALISAGKAYIGWIGDSRVYHYDDSLRLLTVDDAYGAPALDDLSPAAETWRARWRRLDEITERDQLIARPELLSAWQLRNVVTRVLPDDAYRSHLIEYSLADQALVIITSDGIHDNLTHQQLAELVAVARPDGCQAIAELLVAGAGQAIEAGGLRAKDDDLSCVVLSDTARPAADQVSSIADHD
jgi:serine/threonine protein phosphatase PrpC